MFPFDRREIASAKTSGGLRFDVWCARTIEVIDENKKYPP